MAPQRSRRPARRTLRGMRRLGVPVRVFTVLAMLALASPSLTALNPELAGWLPSHGHVYEGGVPVPHTHPWDPPMPPAEPLSVAIGGHDSDHASDPDSGSAPVVFTWDLPSTAQSLAVPAAVGVVLGATWLLLLIGMQPLGLPSAAPAVPTPPPR